MTKGELVQAALNEIGIAGREFDISPEDLEDGVRRLDSMMAMWSSKGIIVSYPFSNNSKSSDDSAVPDTAEEAVYTNLALRLAPSYGKQVSMETKVAAKMALNTLMSFSARPQERQLPLMPKGAGYKNTTWPFTDPPEGQYLDEVDQDMDLSGGYDGG